jgi:hypothetical protein
MAKNTRVADLKEMLANETDPDKIEILKFDLMEAMGRKTTKPVKRVKKSKGGMINKAGMNATSDRANTSKVSRGGGAALRGIKFSGVK